MVWSGKTESVWFVTLSGSPASLLFCCLAYAASGEEQGRIQCCALNSCICGRQHLRRRRPVFFYSISAATDRPPTPMARRPLWATSHTNLRRPAVRLLGNPEEKLLPGPRLVRMCQIPLISIYTTATCRSRSKLCTYSGGGQR